MFDAHRPADVVRVRGLQQTRGIDRVATEEPLEIRLQGRPFAVIMRTPGADRDLAAGFLLSEGVVRTLDDLGAIAHCSAADSDATTGADSDEGPNRRNVLTVTLAGHAVDDLDRIFEGRRLVGGNASCGICGRVTIESLQTRATAVSSPLRVSRAGLLACATALRRGQKTFDETGGLHAAGLFAADGTLIALAEDVGRHNAVDKVVGRLLLGDALPLSDRILFVSGRTSFEIVQKAAVAGVPVVAAVSAPSSLAVDLADAMGITLVGFVRNDGLNIYTHAERVR